MVENNRLKNFPISFFAAGDVRAKRFRQITTAVSDGTVAALNTIEYLQILNNKNRR